jgi:hypothetical protein
MSRCQDHTPNNRVVSSLYGHRGATVRWYTDRCVTFKNGTTSLSSFRGHELPDELLDIESHHLFGDRRRGHL